MTGMHKSARRRAIQFCYDRPRARKSDYAPDNAGESV
jgi:hypothetical protein